MNINRFWLRFMGLSGILGGLILFAGDMLFYYDSASTNLKLNMANASDFRIMASGISALVASWLYMLGIGQVYYAFKPTSTKIRNTVVVCFAGILIAYGIVHGAYLARTNQILRLLVYPIFVVLSYLFISQVWKRKTLYPRLIILFFPLVPFLFKGLVSKTLSGSIWIVVAGGYLNLIMVVFFLASTIALWHPRPREGS